MNIHELLGRAVEARDIERDRFVRTVNLLVRLKRGDVSLEEVHITNNGWSMTPPDTNGVGSLRRDLMSVEDVSGPPEDGGDE